MEMCLPRAANRPPHRQVLPIKLLQRRRPQPGVVVAHTGWEVYLLPIGAVKIPLSPSVFKLLLLAERLDVRIVRLAQRIRILLHQCQLVVKVLREARKRPARGRGQSRAIQ